VFKHAKDITLPGTPVQAKLPRQSLYDLRGTR
jgi:hypothetical protein